jgi:hypothetical protein
MAVVITFCQMQLFGNDLFSSLGENGGEVRTALGHLEKTSLDLSIQVMKYFFTKTKSNGWCL